MKVKIAPMIMNLIQRKLLLIPGYVFFVIICFLPSMLNAQPENWNVRYYSTEEGLSSNHINCVIQDSSGIIWVGTDNGLNWFVGYSFYQLKYESGETHLLSKIKVLSIYEDEKNLLWIGTSEGLFRYDPSEPVDQIKQYKYRDSDNKHTIQQPQPVNRICEDKNGLLWMNCVDADEGIYPGLLTFNKKTETFTEKAISRIDQNEQSIGVDDKTVVDIYCDSKGAIWISTFSGLLKYNYESDSFQKYIPYPGEPDRTANLILFLNEDSHGNFWTPGIYGLYEFDREKKLFEDPIILQEYNGIIGNQSAAYSIREDENGYFWIRINMGLARVKPAPGGGNQLVIEESWIPELSNVSTINQLSALHVENPWSVWMPVSDKGLCHISLQRNQFRLIDPSSVPNSNGMSYVTALYSDSINNLWVSLPGGFGKINMISGDIRIYETLSFSMLNGINIDEHGNLWFTSRFGIHTKAVMDSNSEPNFTTYFPDSTRTNSLTPRNEINAYEIGSVSHFLHEHLIYKDSEGRAWFNSGKGIHDSYDPETDAFTHLDHRRIDYYNNDTCLAERKGEVWFPSIHGLLRILPPFSEISPHTFVPEHTILYKNIFGDPSSLGSDWIKSIYTSKYYEPGTMWIASIGGGLNKMVKKQVGGTDKVCIHFEQFTEENGLCDNNVLGILEDKNGNLWLSTMNGLSKFEPRTKQFINFYEQDGLPGNHFTWAEPCMSPSGEMIFPNTKGIVIFDSDNIEINKETPSLIITSFMIFNEALTPGPNSPIKKDIRFEEKIELAYNQNFISIEFSALSFEAPERNQYMYMLEGLDRDWNLVGNRRYADYTALKPGNYTFKVKGSNNNGIWNEEGKSLYIIIHRPPWYSWWAFLTYSLLLSGLILWLRMQILNRARTRRALQIEKIDKEKAVEIEKVKSRFFTNISHEFRTPLTLIMGHVRELEKQTGKGEQIRRSSLAILGRNARRLLLLINQLLDIARLEKNALQPELTRGDMSEWIRVLISSFQSLADSQEITFITHVEDHDEEACFDPDKTEKIVTNLLSNAFKFTDKKGKVTLSLTYHNAEADKLKNCRIKVEDTGKGLDSKQLNQIFDRFYQASSSDTREVEGSGIGLSLTRELVELLHGKITVESELGKGTSFEVTLPVNEESFPDISISETSTTEEVYTVAEENNDQGAKGEKKKLAPQDPELILVVEDNDDLRKYLLDTLSVSYHVLEAENGMSGFDKAKEQLPDLVISDLMMPVMDGVEMTEKLKKDQATNHIPVIMLTAKADKTSKLEGLETGADDYIIKPFDAEELLVRIRNLIEQRKRLWEKFKQQFTNDPGHQVFLTTDDKLLQKIINILDQHVPDEEFNMDKMAAELNISKSRLFRKVSSVTGYTPNDLLRNMRLKRAAAMFDKGENNISQVIYQVGFNNHSYFSRTFRELYSMNPSQYIKRKS